MYDKILHEMRSRVRAGKLAISIHAREEMDLDGLILDDLKYCILTGAIVERQFDDLFVEYKYVIEGATLDPDEFIHVVAKLGKRNAVIITTYRVW
jgi:Domain of unknown function (DUF4258)